MFLLTVSVTIIIVELLQYASALGSLDVDDLLLNMLGASLGFALRRKDRSADGARRPCFHSSSFTKFYKKFLRFLRKKY